MQAASNIQPLDNVRILDVSSFLAGPFCSAQLAEFGADVLKVELPNIGDALRRFGTITENGDSLPWLSECRNKKSITLDLRIPEGAAILKRLAEKADVMVENFQPGTLEKWGLGWDTLREINPRLIMVRLSGYGQTGPYRDRPGFGVIGESMGGMRYVTGYADRPPVRLGISIGDSIAALYGVIGAMMALHHRNVNGGRGQVVDVALYEAVFSMMESLVPEFDVLGFVRERAGNALPGIVPSNTYPTRDGKFVIVGANNDAIFKRMMTAIGRADLADDATLATNAGRVPRTAELDGAIADWTRRHDLDHVLAALEKAQVPSGKVFDVADIVKDAHYIARGMLEQHKLPDGKPVKLPGIVPKLSATPGATEWIGPKLGEHNAEVLAALGYDDVARQALKARGVI